MSDKQSQKGAAGPVPEADDHREISLFAWAHGHGAGRFEASAPPQPARPAPANGSRLA